MTINLYNTLTKTKQKFIPLNSKTVTMYVCGPTVYDRPHIGNARSTVVYDLLYRLLIHIYGQKQVLYVRNITDVDDKICDAAKERKISISKLTEEMISYFESDMKALNCLPPNLEPKATDHINEMIEIIVKLIEKNHAYIVNNHVYFDVRSYKNYTKLSGRSLNELIAGSRIDVSENKKHPADFVLWKPIETNDDTSAAFDSPWGKGRPGWHIECTAMSTKYLGQDFDIHGGGIDLIFPHHTNEIAQSCSCFEHSNYAKFWIHNGFLTVDGEKMSKSLGNFFTVNELLEKKIAGETIRYILLATHYRKPLNWNNKAKADAQKTLDNFYRIIEFKNGNQIEQQYLDKVQHKLCNDLNSPEAIAILHAIAKNFHKASDHDEKIKLANTLYNSGQLLGFFEKKPYEWFGQDDNQIILSEIEKRKKAKLNKDWVTADEIRNNLKAKGIMIEDLPNGTTTWRKVE
jgi:cysteinyl-tRNA synthetase